MMKNLIVLIFISILSIAARAQFTCPSYGPVNLLEIKDEKYGPAFSFLGNDGKPHIAMNREMMAYYTGGSKAAVLFILLHECGHIVNGDIKSNVPATMEIERELKADCFAAKQLKQMGFSRQDLTAVTVVQRQFKVGHGVHDHPAGELRAHNTITCYEQN
jgi:hypothetical protein